MNSEWKVTKIFFVLYYLKCFRLGLSFEQKIKLKFSYFFVVVYSEPFC